MSRSSCAFKRMCILGVATVFSVGCAVISHQNQETGEAGETDEQQAAAETSLENAPAESIPVSKTRTEIFPGVILIADEQRANQFIGNIDIEVDRSRANSNWPRQIQADQAELLKSGDLRLTGKWKITTSNRSWTESEGADSAAIISPTGQVGVQGKARTVVPANR